MRQLQIYSIKPKLDIRLFVDLAEFPCFYQFLNDVIIKLFCFDRHFVAFWSAEQFYDHFMQEPSKNWEIQLNQQTIWSQVLAELNKIWSCLIFIKLYK